MSRHGQWRSRTRAMVAKLKKKQNHITYTNLHKQGQTGRMVRHISRPPRRDSDVKSEGEHGEPQSLHEKKMLLWAANGKREKILLRSGLWVVVCLRAFLCVPPLFPYSLWLFKKSEASQTLSCVTAGQCFSLSHNKKVICVLLWIGPADLSVVGNRDLNQEGRLSYENGCVCILRVCGLRWAWPAFKKIVVQCLMKSAPDSSCFLKDQQQDFQ